MPYIVYSIHYSIGSSREVSLDSGCCWEYDNVGLDSAFGIIVINSELESAVSFLLACQRRIDRPVYGSCKWAVMKDLGSCGLSILIQRRRT